MVQTPVQWDTILPHGNKRTKLLIHPRNMEESQSNMLNEKSYIKKNKNHIIPFIQHSGKVKTKG